MFAITECSQQAVTGKSAKSGSVQDNSDEALVGAIAGGDRRAMHALYARHHVRAYRFILRLTNDSPLAEDLVSEAFLAVWHHAGKFQGKSQVVTWILAIARHKALTALKRHSEEQLSDEMANAVADDADDAETTLAHQDRSAIIQKCLAQLSADHREVIDLVYYHDKTVDEVAAITGAPRNTVKTRMFYARKCLAKLLEAQGCIEHRSGSKTIH
jgi:RNA polymerase sigma-70 factor (ECF subfamily)